MKKVNVGLQERSYPIWIGEGILETLPGMLDELRFPQRIALITNPTVAKHYAERVVTLLQQTGCHVDQIQIPDGEQYKNLEIFNEVITRLIEKGFDRKCGLIALGGGVVGDLTGFVAASYLRGVPFVQVPTTLLSQVDSSVGGKTAVNHSLGKNLIGAFYQPKGVLVDVSTLKTLEKREFASGMAEVIKYGVIRDEGFFTWLKTSAESLQALDAASLIHAVEKSCQIKADIVENDEKESDLRAILNFGHTFGHAIENLSGYGEVKHGEAVAIGMMVASGIALRQGLCRKSHRENLRNLLSQFKLPVEVPGFGLDEYLEAMSRDKKVAAGRLRLVLNVGIGDCRIVDEPDPRNTFSAVLDEQLA